MHKFKANNNLEHLLEQAQNGKTDFEIFMKKFLIEEIIVPSSVKIIDGNFEPLLFNKEGTYMMASFTSRELLNLYEKEVKQYLVVSGKQMLEQAPHDIGVVINPGYKIGFDISPKGIKQILKDFG